MLLSASKQATELIEHTRNCPKNPQCMTEPRSSAEARGSESVACALQLSELNTNLRGFRLTNIGAIQNELARKGLDDFHTLLETTANIAKLLELDLAPPNAVQQN